MTPQDFQNFLNENPPSDKSRAWKLYHNQGHEIACQWVLNHQGFLPQASVPFNVWGRNNIEQATIDQMTDAMRIPVAVAGALMPDAHLGYGLPIGGVWALQNAVSPYAVGFDIGCRMRLTVFNVPWGYFNRDHLGRTLQRCTAFGKGANTGGTLDHPVLWLQGFDDIKFLRDLRDLARYQLGSSGSGNHFVEFGEVNGSLALLSHSGSRGLGHRIAEHYGGIAEQQIGTDNPILTRLAWLDLDTEGAEYWAAMELAGEYAKANHHVIHNRIMRELDLGQPALVIENHHNFAWKEDIGGEQLIVHRKGATPAATLEVGIIPTSMTTPAYIVEGKGNEAALNSASHGAGRKMSRKAALNTFTVADQEANLKAAGVTLVDGVKADTLDESPMAYKDGAEVMAEQTDLVKIIGQFNPKVVKMDG